MKSELGRHEPACVSGYTRMKEPSVHSAHSARLRAILASFAVYLLPVVGPHSAVLLGPTLVMLIAEGRNNREPLWIVADFALALCLLDPHFFAYTDLREVRVLAYRSIPRGPASPTTRQRTRAGQPSLRRVSRFASNPPGGDRKFARRAPAAPPFSFQERA